MFVSFKTEFLLSHELHRSFCFSHFFSKWGEKWILSFSWICENFTRLERASCALVLSGILTCCINSVHSLTSQLSVFSLRLFLESCFGACCVLALQEVPTGVRHHYCLPRACSWKGRTVGCVPSSQVVVQVVHGSSGLGRWLPFLSSFCHLQCSNGRVTLQREISVKSYLQAPLVFFLHKKG